jgi:hypothetical protein
MMIHHLLHAISSGVMSSLGSRMLIFHALEQHPSYGSTDFIDKVLWNPIQEFQQLV